MPALAHRKRHASGDAQALQGDRAAMAASAGGLLDLIAESFARLAGKPLVGLAPAGYEPAMWQAPRAIGARGIGFEPRYFYGNRMLLDLLGMSASELAGTSPRQQAEPLLRAERERMIDELARNDIVEIYGVVGLTATGRRFAISDAQIWNLIDRRGGRHGLGITFSAWRYLDGT